MAKDERKQLEEDLIESHRRWEELYTKGGHDPFWPDGCNLELVRNHIIYYRTRMEKLNFYPEIYNKEVPQNVDRNYMARRDEIRANAMKSLERYRKDENYLYLLGEVSSIDKKEASGLSIGAVLGYVQDLAEAISQNNYVAMRRHENPDMYMERFLSCRLSLERLLMKDNSVIQFSEEKNGQFCFAF